MRKPFTAIAALFITAGFATVSFAADLTVTGTAALVKDGEIQLSGAGFAPAQEVVLLFTTKDGVTSDISYALDPAPVADADGNWATTWSYGRFVKKKLVSAGAFSLQATDDEFNELGATEITFVD